MLASTPSTIHCIQYSVETVRRVYPCEDKVWRFSQVEIGNLNNIDAVHF